MKKFIFALALLVFALPLLGAFPVGARGAPEPVAAPAYFSTAQDRSFFSEPCECNEADEVELCAESFALQPAAGDDPLIAALQIEYAESARTLQDSAAAVFRQKQLFADLSEKNKLLRRETLPAELNKRRGKPDPVFSKRDRFQPGSRASPV